VDTGFRGFGPEAFEWFAGLERDNSKTYFTATRERYENDVRGAFTAMLDELCEQVGGEVRVFRQYRDLRFSPDKSPYKTRTYGIIAGAPSAPSGLYAQLSARGLYAGTGYHQMARDQLERFREAVVDDRTGPELGEAVDAARRAGLDIDGESLRTAPRGYTRDHPRIELLRLKSLVAGRALAAGDGIDRDAALRHVGGSWRAATPVTAWLEAHVGESTIPPDDRGRRR
jgi:uncharacterized protein (TIGR02453 family)